MHEKSKYQHDQISLVTRPHLQDWLCVETSLCRSFLALSLWDQIPSSQLKMELPQTLVYHITDDKYHFIHLERTFISVHFDLKPHSKHVSFMLTTQKVTLGACNKHRLELGQHRNRHDWVTLHVMWSCIFTALPKLTRKRKPGWRAVRAVQQVYETKFILYFTYLYINISSLQ